VIMQRLTRICIAQLVIKCHIRTFGDFRWKITFVNNREK
jgi:hypothetical protein